MDTLSYTSAALSGSHRGDFIDTLLLLCMACQCCKKHSIYACHSKDRARLNPQLLLCRVKLIIAAQLDVATWFIHS